MALTAKSPPAATGGTPNALSWRALSSSDHKTTAALPQGLPNRATLARCWPGLRVNRLTWRWVDVASGRRGDSIETLLAFLGEA
uniref:hypothetical protein n=1 Tax=Methylocystis sp. TaxID=1911079 RepID=UPI0025F8794E